jgi:hypothetical protein
MTTVESVLLDAAAASYPLANQKQASGEPAAEPSEPRLAELELHLAGVVAVSDEADAADEAEPVRALQRRGSGSMAGSRSLSQLVGRLSRTSSTASGGVLAEEEPGSSSNNVPQRLLRTACLALPRRRLAACSCLPALVEPYCLGNGSRRTVLACVDAPTLRPQGPTLRVSSVASRCESTCGLSPAASPCGTLSRARYCQHRDCTVNTPGRRSPSTGKAEEDQRSFRLPACAPSSGALALVVVRLCPH